MTKHETNKPSASITLNCHPNCSIEKIKQRLTGMPLLKPSKDAMTYTIIEKAGRAVPEIEFGSDHITLKYNPTHQPQPALAENMALLLSIIAYLDNAYTVRIESIYEPLIGALTTCAERQRAGRADDLELLTRRIRVLDELNTKLSLRLIELEGSKNDKT